MADTGQLDVSIQTTDMESMVVEGDQIVRNIQDALEEIDKQLEVFRSSEILKGEAAKGLETFIDTVRDDIVKSGIAFNDKTINAAKVIYHQFNEETHLSF